MFEPRPKMPPEAGNARSTRMAAKRLPCAVVNRLRKELCVKRAAPRRARFDPHRGGPAAAHQTRLRQSRKGLQCLLLGVEDLEELAELRGVEDVHDLRADLAELELARFLLIFFRSMSMMPSMALDSPTTPVKFKSRLMTIGPIGHVEQLVAELLDGQLVENSMLAEADHDHGALFAEPQEVARRSAALVYGVFFRQGKRPVGQRRVTSRAVGMGDGNDLAALRDRPFSAAEAPNRSGRRRPPSSHPPSWVPVSWALPCAPRGDAGAAARWRRARDAPREAAPKPQADRPPRPLPAWGTTIRALQCGQRPAFPANSLLTCSACPLGQTTLIDIHHLVQKSPPGRPSVRRCDQPPPPKSNPQHTTICEECQYLFLGPCSVSGKRLA